MKIKNIILATLFLTVLYACEIEKTEYEKITYNEKADFFDTNSVFIVHDQSISYYNLQSNEITEDLFYYINGRPLANNVHSIAVDTLNEIGIITLEASKTIEFINSMNFVSLGSIEIRDEPKYIQIYNNMLWYDVKSHLSFISCGHDPGSVCVVNHNTQRIVYRLYTGYNPGKIFVDKYIYVLNSGGLENDSTIAVIDSRDYYNFAVTDKIVVDYNPVDIIKGDNNLVAVLCRGKTTYNENKTAVLHQDPASIVICDLFKKDIIERYVIEDEIYRPKKLFSFSYHDKKIELIANHKLYSFNLDNLSDKTILIDKNISDITDAGEILAISEGEKTGKNYLYRFENNSYTITDSLKLNDIPVSILKP